MNKNKWRRLELNGGQVSDIPHWRFQLSPARRGYADAQIDDYGPAAGHAPRFARRYFPWQPGVTLQLRARFSHPKGALLGTAGFGFWNAPFGDPTVPWPALPQATWFFYASKPSDLPLAINEQGRGWFASTLDATKGRALALAPLAPAVLLMNQFRPLRKRVWPMIRRRLSISFAPVPVSMTEWHEYALLWLPDRCVFRVDGGLIMQTAFSPRGPLGFVCWLDNQYLALTPDGRFRWGTLSLPATQWMEVADLTLKSF